jgi:hypothetical protein
MSGVVVFLYLSPACFADNLVPLNLDDEIYSRLSNEEKQLIAEYYQSYFAVRKYYMNVSIFAQRKFYDMVNPEGLPLPPDAPPVLRRIDEFEFRANSEKEEKIYFRMDKTISFFRSDDENIEKGNREGFVSKEVGILTPEKGYMLQKNNKDKPYFALVAVRDTNKVFYQVDLFERAAYSNGNGGVMLENLIFKKPAYNVSEYYIESVTPITEHNDSLIEIVIRAVGKDSSRKLSWRIKLLRDQSWAVKEVFHQSLTRSGEPWWTKSVCSYDSNTNTQCPMLRSFILERGQYHQEKMYPKEREEYSITKFVPGAVPLSEFDVAQFLPPETKIGVTTSSFSYFRLFCLIAGLLLLALGIYLKIRNART